MANYLRYADDILRGGRRAAGNLVDAFPVNVPKNRMVLSGSDVPNVRGLDGVNFNFGDMPERAPVIWGRDGLRETIPDPKNGYPNLAGEYPSGLAGQSLPTPQARNMGKLNRNAALATGGAALGGTGLAYAGSQGMFDGISLNDIDFGSSAASEPTPSSSPAQSRSIAQTRGTGRTPEGNDKTMFDWMKGDGTPSSGGSSMTSRANSNSRRAANNSPAVNPTPSISPAEAAAVEQAVVEQAAVEQAVAEQAAAQAVTEGTWTPQRGDTLYSKFGGDWDKINAFAELNKIDPDEIYAGRVYQMLANTPSMSVLNTALR